MSAIGILYWIAWIIWAFFGGRRLFYAGTVQWVAGGYDILLVILLLIIGLCLSRFGYRSHHMPIAPAKLIFVKNVLMSSILWTALGNECTILAGLFAINWGDKTQYAAIAAGVGSAFNGLTAILRIFRDNGPVAIKAPASPPASQEVPAGSSVVSVPAPKDIVQTPVVQPLVVGPQHVEITAPVTAATLLSAKITPVPAPVPAVPVAPVP